MDRNAVLPDRCFKCNEPADGYRRTVKLTHVPLGAEMMVGATKITDPHVWLKGAGESFLASLPDAPAVGAGGTLPTLDVASVAPADPAVAAAAAFRDVRNGALTFLAGCIVTFGTYALLPGRYFIAWGAVIYGLVRLVRGARVYLKVPAEHRRMGQALALVA